MRADLAALQVREIIGTQAGVLVTGVVVGLCRPLLRRPAGAYVLGGLAAVAFFGTQFIILGAFSGGGLAVPVFLALMFIVGVAMTPLIRYDISSQDPPPFAWIDKFLSEVWHAPPDPRHEDPSDQDTA